MYIKNSLQHISDLTNALDTFQRAPDTGINTVNFKLLQPFTFDISSDEWLAFSISNRPGH